MVTDSCVGKCCIKNSVEVKYINQVSRYRKDS